MKVFRCLLGVSSMERTRNEPVRWTAQSPRGSDGLHMCRGGRVNMMELPGRRRTTSSEGVDGCSGGGHGVTEEDRRKADDPLGRPLKGASWITRGELAEAVTGQCPSKSNLLGSTSSRQLIFSSVELKCRLPLTSLKCPKDDFLSRWKTDGTY